jgi:integrase
MSKHQLNRLSAIQIKTKPVGMHCDGGGLYLQVKQDKQSGNLSRSWIFKFATGERTTSSLGKTYRVERYMGLGPIELVSLAEARQRATECRRLAHAGTDPIEAQRLARANARASSVKAPTFSECAERYIAAHEAGWRNPKHRAQWRSTLETYAHPIIGSMSVAKVDTTAVLRVLEPIWRTTPETASRVRGRIELVLTWATVREYRAGENPGRWRGHLDQLLPRRTKVRRVQHHLALPYADMPAFMARLRGQGGIAARALEFAILTAARTGEATGASLAEVDFNAHMWTVSGERMKAGRDHRVPLCDQAMEILRSTPRGASSVLFPGQRGILSNMSMLAVLDRMGYRNLTTVHGFRSTFRDWAAERTSFPSEVVEMALAHAVSDKVEAAYRRGDLLERRRRLMDVWAEFLESASTSATVTPLRAAG